MWVKIDDSLADHPKIEAAGPAAAWLYVCGLCYCARYLTDGRIPKSRIERLTALHDAKSHAQRLIEVGLWHDLGDEIEVHDFLAFNPSRAQKERERAAARERQARFRRKNGEVTANERRSNGVTDAVTSPSPSRPLNDPPIVPQGTTKRRKKRELSEGARRVRETIANLVGTEYPPASFDALEVRLRDGDLTVDDALVIVRWAAADRFWGAEVRCDPSTLFRPKHWPGLLAKAKAQPSLPPPDDDEPEYARRLL